MLPHFTGRTVWIGSEETSSGTVLEAVDRGPALAMDIRVDRNEELYTVILSRSIAGLSGEARARSYASHARCQAEEIVGEHNRALVGIWIEDGERYEWWVKLDVAPGRE